MGVLGNVQIGIGSKELLSEIYEKISRLESEGYRCLAYERQNIRSS